jgi:hypothetical protein
VRGAGLRWREWRLRWLLRGEANSIVAVAAGGIVIVIQQAFGAAKVPDLLPTLAADDLAAAVAVRRNIGVAVGA